MVFEAVLPIHSCRPPARRNWRLTASRNRHTRLWCCPFERGRQVLDPFDIRPGLAAFLDPNELLRARATCTSPDGRASTPHYFICVAVRGTESDWMATSSHPAPGRVLVQRKWGHPSWVQPDTYADVYQVWTTEAWVIRVASVADRSRRTSATPPPSTSCTTRDARPRKVAIPRLRAPASRPRPASPAGRSGTDRRRPRGDVDPDGKPPARSSGGDGSGTKAREGNSPLRHAVGGSPRLLSAARSAAWGQL